MIFRKRRRWAPLQKALNRYAVRYLGTMRVATRPSDWDCGRCFDVDYYAVLTGRGPRVVKRVGPRIDRGVPLNIVAVWPEFPELVAEGKLLEKCDELEVVGRDMGLCF